MSLPSGHHDRSIDQLVAVHWAGGVACHPSIAVVHPLGWQGGSLSVIAVSIGLMRWLTGHHCCLSTGLVRWLAAENLEVCRSRCS